MPLQSGHVFKLRLYRDAQQARQRNSRDIRMFLEESELWILSRISHQKSKTGLMRQVRNTVNLYNLELGDFEYPVLSILNVIIFTWTGYTLSDICYHSAVFSQS